MKTLVVLKDEDIKDAVVLSRRSMYFYGGRIGPYSDSSGLRNNSRHQHLVGRIGEIAVERFLQSAKCEVASIFRTPHDTYCDIAINRPGGSIRVEVKTFSAPFWREDGRCVCATQLPRILIKADIVMWCRSHVEVQAGFSKTSGGRVDLMGFSTMADMNTLKPTMTGLRYGPGKANLQLRAEEIRGMEDLAEWIVNFRFKKRFIDNYHTRYGPRPIGK